MVCVRCALPWFLICVARVFSSTGFSTVCKVLASCSDPADPQWGAWRGGASLLYHRCRGYHAVLGHYRHSRGGGSLSGRLTCFSLDFILNLHAFM